MTNGAVKPVATTETDVWDDPFTQQLASVLCAIDGTDKMERFLRDVMTEREIFEISARLQAAMMLDEGSTYATVTEVTNLSSRTIARISDWLTNGLGGYRVAISILRGVER